MIITELISHWFGRAPKSVDNHKDSRCDSLYMHNFQRSKDKGAWYKVAEVVRCHAKGPHITHYTQGTMLDITWTEKEVMK